MSKPIPLNWLAALHDRLDAKNGVLRVWLVWTRWHAPDIEQQEELFLDRDEAVAYLCRMVDDLMEDTGIELDAAHRIHLASLSGKPKFQYFFTPEIQDKIRGDVLSVGIRMPRLQ